MRIIPIDETPHQNFTIPFEGESIKIELNYRLDFWLMDIQYKDKSIYGIKLSSSVLMLKGKNYPFEIVVDNKGNKLDPFSIDSFSKGHFDLILIEREELEEIRGYEVE